MPLKPDLGGHQPSPHVIRYANRVARLSRGAAPAGYALIKPDVLSTRLAGHLWWRRWGPPRDAFWVWTVVDGQFTDSYITEPDRVFEETVTWDRGVFEHYGELLAAEWLTGRDGTRVRADAFGA
ncbi:hypothetical protein GCM10028777_00790 [Angustibacter speluncae]